MAYTPEQITAATAFDGFADSLGNREPDKLDQLRSDMRRMLELIDDEFFGMFDATASMDTLRGRGEDSDGVSFSARRSTAETAAQVTVDRISRFIPDEMKPKLRGEL